MTSQEIMKKLQEPFKPEDIEWRVQSCGVSNGRPWAMVLAYIQARAIQNRLDEVFGWDNWFDEYRQLGNDVICRLSVKFNDQLIYKENGATNTDIEAFKGGISGSLKRVAASGYGIGRYLYNLTESFADCQLEKPANDKGWRKAKTKDKQVIYWKEPTLPNWALPEGYQYPTNNKPSSPPPKQQQPTDKSKQGEEPKEYKCSVCGTTEPMKINQSVYEYSTKKLGKSMCRDCQKKNAKVG